MKIVGNKIKEISADFIKVLDNGKHLFCKNGKFMTFYEDIPDLFTIADKNKDEFIVSTQDLDKDNIYKNFSVWPEIDELLVDTGFDPDIYKC